MIALCFRLILAALGSSRRSLFALGLLSLGAVSPAGAEVIASSFADFSGDQGPRWYWGYYSYTQDASRDAVYTGDDDDFIAFTNLGAGPVSPDGNHWDGSMWDLIYGVPPWTELGPLNTHPNGTGSPWLHDDGTTYAEEQWTIRRWVSDRTAKLAITWHVAKTDVTCGVSTGGVTGHVFVSGLEVDRVSIPGDDGVGVTRTVTLDIKSGDAIDLALDPTNADGDRFEWCDGSITWLEIDTQIPADGDHDGIVDSLDNCPEAANSDQVDRDVDGVGDACEEPWIADSYYQWSVDGTQGANGWTNGYYDLGLDPDSTYSGDESDFREFVNDGSGGATPCTPEGNHWSGQYWDLNRDGPPWTYMDWIGVHPNGVDYVGGEQWLIRRWESDRDAKVAITWHMRRTDPNGWGVTGILFLNGVELDRSTLYPTDRKGVTRTVVANVEAGDFIDLALTPEGLCSDHGCCCDSTFNFLTIRQATDGEPTAGEVLADSMLDWSVAGVQGQGGWYYGYYDVRADVESGNKTYQAGDFVMFLTDGSGVVSKDPEVGAWRESSNHWDGATWDLLYQGDPDGVAGSGDEITHGPWTQVFCYAAYPAGNLGGDPEVHWAIRRWVSDTSGGVNLSGYVFTPNTCGDGTVLRIFHNNTEIYSTVSTRTHIHFSVPATVAVNDTLDFAIDPDGAGRLATAGIDAVQDACDGTACFVTIRSTSEASKRFWRADPNNDGQTNITDGVYVLNFLFLGGGAPSCLESADSNDDGTINITDGVHILNYLFLGGEAPKDPGPPKAGASCGTDPAGSKDLGCAVYRDC